MCESTFTTSLRLENHKKKQHKEEDPNTLKESEGMAVTTENPLKPEPAEGNDNSKSILLSFQEILLSMLVSKHATTFQTLYNNA